MPNIKITAKSEPYRRCGLSHTRAGIIHLEGRFTDEQLEQLRKDPHLIVAETDEAPAVRLGDSQCLRTDAIAAFCRHAEARAVELVQANGEDWNALSAADRDARINGVFADFIAMTTPAEATRNADLAAPEPPSVSAAEASEVADDATTQPPASDATSPDEAIAKPDSKPAAAKASTRGKAK